MIDSYITISPSLGDQSDFFIKYMKKLKKDLDKCSDEERSNLLANQRSTLWLQLEQPQTTDELKLSFVINVIIDLLTIGWSLDIKKNQIKVGHPRLEQETSEGKKDFIRKGHLVERDAQLSESSVVEFIRTMERRRLTSKGWHSIFSVMRDGASLAQELASAVHDKNKEESLDLLSRTISPYIQPIVGEDQCEHTGLKLKDIWRYFRHTWVNTYKSLPGRSMMFLIRDAASQNHPVIGIAALGSSVAQQKLRDEWIGWDQDTFIKRVVDDPSEKYGRWIMSALEKNIKCLYLDDLLAERIIHVIDIEYPTDIVIDALMKESDKAIKKHQQYPKSYQIKPSQAHPGNVTDWETQARTNLFRSKRCKTLAQLLKIKKVLQKNGFKSGTREELELALRSSEVRTCIGQLVRMVKADQVGINMMDIVICGAIPPYNAILGGKLVCMLLCSPEVVKAYSDRYNRQLSIIASSMKGSPVIKEPKLVLLSTTSLYSVGSSQYNRVKIPCEHIGGNSNQYVEYLELGKGKGFGTYHLSNTTKELAEKLAARNQNGKRVNSIFGEGANPRMRSLREAFDEVNLPSDEILRHGNPRIVYTIALAENFREVLLGFEESATYYIPLSDMTEHTNQIAAYWRRRWLLGRIERPGILEEVSKHTLSYPVRHGARVPLPLLVDEDNC